METYPELLLKIMGEEGKSFTAFCASLSISKDTGYEWIKNYPLFSAAFKIASQKCESFWEKKYVQYMEENSANPGLVKFWMTNRFKWGEKFESYNTNDNNNLNAPAELSEVLDARKKYEKDI